MPASRSASPPTARSAKNPSVKVARSDEGRWRQHSRLLNTTSAARKSPAIFRNGTSGSATFMRLTSPVKTSVLATPPPPHLKLARACDLLIAPHVPGCKHSGCWGILGPVKKHELLCPGCSGERGFLLFAIEHCAPRRFRAQTDRLTFHPSLSDISRSGSL